VRGAFHLNQIGKWVLLLLFLLLGLDSFILLLLLLLFLLLGKLPFLLFGLVLSDVGRQGKLTVLQACCGVVRVSMQYATYVHAYNNFTDMHTYIVHTHKTLLNSTACVRVIDTHPTSCCTHTLHPEYTCTPFKFTCAYMYNVLHPHTLVHSHARPTQPRLQCRDPAQHPLLLPRHSSTAASHLEPRRTVAE
jgi:hypothetical protein